MMVITIVAKTTTVAPKLRAKSFRIEEWNNMTFRKTPIMNFELKTLSLAAAAKTPTETLIVLISEHFQAGKDPLSALIEKAISQQKGSDRTTMTDNDLKIMTSIKVAPTQNFFATQNQRFSRFVQSLFL
jgi:hypothetical protein